MLCSVRGACFPISYQRRVANCKGEVSSASPNGAATRGASSCQSDETVFKNTRRNISWQTSSISMSLDEGW
jgi:hypothetical protein